MTTHVDELHTFLRAHPALAVLWIAGLVFLWASYPLRHRLKLLGVQRVRHRRTKFDPPAWVISRGLGGWYRRRPRWLNRRHPVERMIDFASRVLGTVVLGALIWLTLF